MHTYSTLQSECNILVSKLNDGAFALLNKRLNLRESSELRVMQVLQEPLDIRIGFLDHFHIVYNLVYTVVGLHGFSGAHGHSACQLCVVAF